MGIRSDAPGRAHGIEARTRPIRWLTVLNNGNAVFAASRKCTTG